MEYIESIQMEQVLYLHMMSTVICHEREYRQLLLFKISEIIKYGMEILLQAVLDTKIHHQRGMRIYEQQEMGFIK